MTLGEIRPSIGERLAVLAAAQEDVRGYEHVLSDGGAGQRELRIVQHALHRFRRSAE